MAFAPARTSSQRPPGVRRSRAFTLIEVVVVLFIGGVLLAMAAALTRGVVSYQKRSLTATRMAGAEAALIQFVQQQRRLPCPGNGALASTDNNAGTEGARDATGCTNQSNGVLPWRALALTEAEATDGWDRRITYRTDPVLAADGRLDMSRCDPAGSAGVGGAGNYCQACTAATVAACTRPFNFIQNRGLKVQTVAGTVVLMDPVAAVVHTGAAFVLISHGESGGGARMGSGQLSQSLVTDGTEEAKNYVDLAVRLPPLYYVDDALSEVSGATHFDDVILRPSLLGVITRAGLGPRPQP
jgi:prepilin-type N-terminal cleavage/methylation domain-containing protein